MWELANSEVTQGENLAKQRVAWFGTVFNENTLRKAQSRSTHGVAPEKELVFFKDLGHVWKRLALCNILKT